MSGDTALMIADEIIKKANQVLKGHRHISADAVAIAAPLAAVQVPAVAVLVAHVRAVLLPAAEHVVATEHLTEIAIALNTIEDAMAQAIATATEAKARIDAMSETEIEQYVSLG